MKSLTQLVLLVCFGSLLCQAQAQNVVSENALAPLRGITAVQIDPTAVPNPDKVKDPSASNLMQDSLRNAFRSANFETVASAPVRAHIVLDEFTSGNTAKRVLIGLGAGRSSITCHLVLEDSQGKELMSRKIHVRGDLAFSPYEGNNTQRRKAVSSLDQRLLEEIEKAK